MLRSLLIAFAALATTCTAADWPRLLGPNDNCTTPEKGLLKAFPKAGPPVLWETEKGSGFGGPAIVDGKLVFFHRVDGKEVIECRDAKTGAKLWSHSYEASYRPRYGGSEGPRTSPVIAGGTVFTFGITGKITALEFATGKVIWTRDAAADFHMGRTFFGYGSTPLVLGEKLIVQVGGKIDGTAVNTVALDVTTGKLVWAAKHAWGASYASPIPAKIHGKQCVLVFAGGESRPPTGGLLVIDAGNGAILSETSHRAEIAESVSASSPALLGNRVFISESYSAGGVCLELAPDFSTKVAWSAPNTGAYWTTPIIADGKAYVVAGQSERLAEIVCHDIASGKEIWRTELEGNFGRASLLQTGDGVLCLGEFGDLAWIELGEKAPKILSRCKLFDAPETWTLPAISNGLLYVCQNESGNSGKPRLICYDLRAK